MENTFELGTDSDTTFEVTPTGRLILTFSQVYIDECDSIVPRSFTEKEALQLKDFLNAKYPLK